MRPWFDCIVILIVLIFSFTPSVHAQKKTKDERHEMVTRDKQVKEKVDDLIYVSEQSLEKNPEDALQRSENAAMLSRGVRYLKGEAYARQQSGKAFLKMSQYKLAQKSLEASQKILTYTNDHAGVAVGYNLLGESYERRGLSDSALVFFSKAANLGLEIGNKEITGRAYYFTAVGLLYTGDNLKALSYLEKVEKIAFEINSKDLFAYVHEGRGHAYMNLGRNEEALSEFTNAMQLYNALENTSRVGKCYYLIGLLFTRKGEYDTALALNLRGLQILEHLPAKDNMAQVLNSIGVIYFKRGDYKTAVNYFSRSLKLWREVENLRSSALVSSNIGSIYLALGNYDSALFIYRLGLPMARALKTKDLFGNLYINMAVAHFQRNAYDSSLYFSRHALSIADTTGNKTQIIDACNGIGKALFKMGNFDDAIRFFNRAILLAKEIDSKNQIMETYEMLSEAFSSTRNFQRALHYHQLHDSINNTLFNEKLNKNIAEVEARYESEKKDKILARNNLVLNEQRLTLAQNKFFIAALTSCLLVLIMIGFFLRLKQRKRQMALKQEYDQKHFKIEQLLELARLKSDVFTNISHEFRTPLTLFLTPLEQMIKETGNEQLKKRYEMMHRNANQLLDMVNQLLELSKIESGHDHLQVACYDVVNFIREILQFFTPLKEKHGINIVLLNELELPYLYFDKDKLEKVFYNLLSNAFKYSDKDSCITLCLRAKNDHGNTDFPEGFVEITVKDCGRGIAREHIPYIFNRFYQVDAHAENGSGIGLALVKEIVEMHAGSIAVKSEPGAGTGFIVCLPVGHAHFHEKELIHPAPVSEFKNRNFEGPDNWIDTDQASVALAPGMPTVMIVEDNIEVNKYISELFLKSYNVIHVSDGRKGLDLAAQHSPDLIICDVMMPGLDGYAFTTELKNTLATSHIPVILLTAKVDQKHKQEGFDAGADDYITKPFHAEELLARSENMITQRKKLRCLFSKAPFTNTSKMVPSEPDQKLIAKATSIVIRHLDDPEFDVEKFCQEIAMSYTVLHKKLKAITGQHVTRFIRCIRLKKAVEFIEADAGTMSDIASWVGFNNRQFFIRSFREQYGMTPTEYKITLRKKSVEQ